MQSADKIVMRLSGFLTNVHRLYFSMLRITYQSISRIDILKDMVIALARIN
jgi:hypothetical protein